MSKDYFHRVHRQTETRFWVNNPTEEEMKKALEAGAVSCTTNPAYCSRLLKVEPEYLNGLIDDVHHNFVNHLLMIKSIGLAVLGFQLVAQIPMTE